MRILSLLFLLLSIFPSNVKAANYPAGNWSHVIDGQDFADKPLVLEGESGSNTLVINSKFHSSKDIRSNTTTEYDAISLRNVSNVYITNNEIYSIPGFGITLRSTGSTDHVTIDNNKIHNIKYTGIIPKRNYDNPGVDHTNLLIKNNIIHDVGSSDYDHGMYIIARDAVIQNNTIYGSKGNGISIRSSGVISGNTIWDTQKSCIRYFSDHETGPSKKLLIENNVCYGVAVNDYPLISMLYSSGGKAEWLPDNYVIRFNTLLASNKTTPGIQVQSSQFDSKRVNVYGNLSINTVEPKNAIVPQYVDYLSRNYTGNSLAGFKVSSLPYDLHISASSEAKGYATGEVDYPSTDHDGKSRESSSLDAGAFVSSSVIPEIIPLLADANNDHHVDENDFEVWKTNFMSPKNGYGASYADFDKNSLTDGVDYMIWIINYGK